MYVSVRFGAHPRSRGENARDLLSPKDGSGSSPLTRGKPAGRRSLPTISRLIPAHAGKTTFHFPKTYIGRAHPRSRGENLTGAEDQLVSLGSSPLTRGKRLADHAAEARERLIPAHAGKTRSDP